MSVANVEARLAAKRGEKARLISEVESHFTELSHVHNKVWQFAKKLHSHRGIHASTTQSPLHKAASALDLEVGGEDHPAAPVAHLAQVPEQAFVTWAKLIDDETGYPYYVNTVTGESTWDAPQGFVDVNESETYLEPYDPSMDLDPHSAYWSVVQSNGEASAVRALVSFVLIPAVTSAWHEAAVLACSPFGCGCVAVRLKFHARTRCIL